MKVSTVGADCKIEWGVFNIIWILPAFLHEILGKLGNEEKEVSAERVNRLLIPI